MTRKEGWGNGLGYHLCIQNEVGFMHNQIFDWKQ